MFTTSSTHSLNNKSNLSLAEGAHRVYPFGMAMVGRDDQGDYRFGFNGHEKDDEMKGNGNHLSFGDNGYDPRVGRRWNIDSVVKEHESSYVGVANNPIWFGDPDGNDWNV
jgi:RHS repeat-associated protein